MARPKAQADSVQVKDKLIEAFWKMLERENVDQVTVSQLIGAVKCTRGTFYYHYDDMADLFAKALERETADRYGAPARIFAMITSLDTERLGVMANERPVQRVALAMRKGGARVVEDALAKSMRDLWKAVLCPDGSELTPKACVVIDYTISGTLRLIELRSSSEGDEELARSIGEYLAEVVPFQIEQVCKAQGLSRQEVETRLAIAGKIMGSA